MSATINLPNLTVNTIVGNCNVGTITTTDRSIKAASTAFVVNLVNYITSLNNLLINVVGNIYSVTGIKTFAALYLNGGTSATTISLGENADIVNILPASSTTQTISINGQSQLLQSNYGTNTFTKPVVTLNTYNKIVTGSVSTSTSQINVVFASTGAGTSFAVGCTPLVIVTTGNADPRVVYARSVTNTGFTAVASINVTVINWVAIGF